MTPEQRRDARERLDLFLHAEGGGSPVSRAELAGYLDAALDQMDADEGLMEQALKVLNDCACRTHWLDALEDMRLLLRARLGEVPQGEEAEDGEAKV